MHKEAERQDQQTGMQKIILELNARNSAEGGMLFATFGRGKSEALIFPTSAVISEGTDKDPNEAEEFLMVTNHGYKIIHVDDPLNLVGKSFEAKAIAIIVENRLGKKQDSSWDFFPSHSGYEDNRLILYRRINIALERTFYYKGSFSDPPQVYTNCRLVEAFGSQVENILDLNIKRVEALRATSQKVSSILGKAS